MGKHLVQKPKKEKNDKAFKLDFKKLNKIENNLSDNKDQIEEKKSLRKSLSFPRSKSGEPVAIAVSALLLAVIPFCPLENWMITAAYAVALLIAALDPILDVAEKINEKNYFATEYGAVIAAFISFAIGLNVEAVLIILLYRISRIIIKQSEKLSREELDSFCSGLPEYANVETAEGFIKVSPEYVKPGEIIQVEAGEIIPLDGVIIEGISTLDTSAVSGRNAAVPVAEGHRVYSGCRNITGMIKLQVLKNDEQSTFSRIVKIAGSSVEYPARQQVFSDKLRKYIVPTMFAASVILCVILAFLDFKWSENLSRITILLVVSSFSVALCCVKDCYVRALGIGSSYGVFSKGADCIENMAKSETIVFDKTGIITEGRYIISDVFPNKVSEKELLTIAATAERFSRHPIARVLREAAGDIDIDYSSLQIEEIPGRGVSAFVANKQVYVGNTALLEEHGIKCAVPSRSGAAIHVAVDYKYWGHILITDRIRHGAFDALEKLRAQGVKKMVLLTGDVLSVARPLASKLNFDMLRAELKPSEKLSAVEYLMSNRGENTALAFVGDGNSDEQIMSCVDVGIAIGSLGSDEAMAAADVLVMARDIKRLPKAFEISRKCYLISLENILAWLVVNFLILVLGVIGVLSVLFAVITEFIMICAVFINTMRMNERGKNENRT